MGWQDRPYSRDQGSSSNPLLWIFAGSVPLFTAFGIRVRMHASLLLLIILVLATSELPNGMGATNAITLVAALFVIVLLHEFGHCFAARSVGGEANDILMWPLGGLAYADAPHRPWPQFFTAAGGPLVNVAICLITAGLAWVISLRHPQILWNPLTQQVEIPSLLSVQFYLWWIFAISWALLLFNLLPIFPLDGGRLLQGLLWFKLKYYRATLITCVVGMVGSVLMAMYGLVTITSWFDLMLVCIAFSCFMTCLQLRAQLKAAGPWGFEDEGTEYGGHFKVDEHPRKHKKLSRRQIRRLRRQADEEEAEQVRIDVILAKVSAHGMHSLTWTERRALRRATERQRQRDMELSRDRC